MLDALVVLLSLQSPEQESTFDEQHDSDSSPVTCFEPLDVCAAGRLGASIGTADVGFGLNGLLRISERRAFEFGGIAIPDRSTVARDFTVRFERSGVFVSAVDTGVVFLGTRDPKIGRFDRLLVMLKVRYRTRCFKLVVYNEKRNRGD